MAALILEGAFSSGKDLGKVFYPFMPRIFLPNILNCIAKIKTIDFPKLFINAVDDEIVTTQLAKTFLERHGFAVYLAHDGEEALEIANKESPDLILLDVMLPKKDGFEVCRTLKAQKKFQKTPILMFTAKGLSKDVEMGRDAGADEFIIKPFSGKALVAPIRKHLGMSS